jgi:hypothetical protein
MRHLRIVKRCIRLDHIKKEGIRKEAKIQSVQTTTDVYRQNWIYQLDIMTDEEYGNKF